MNGRSDTACLHKQLQRWRLRRASSRRRGGEGAGERSWNRSVSRPTDVSPPPLPATTGAERLCPAQGPRRGGPGGLEALVLSLSQARSTRESVSGGCRQRRLLGLLWRVQRPSFFFLCFTSQSFCSLEQHDRAPSAYTYRYTGVRQRVQSTGHHRDTRQNRKGESQTACADPKVHDNAEMRDTHLTGSPLLACRHSSVCVRLFVVVCPWWCVCVCGRVLGNVPGCSPKETPARHNAHTQAPALEPAHTITRSNPRTKEKNQTRRQLMEDTAGEEIHGWERRMSERATHTRPGSARDWRKKNEST